MADKKDKGSMSNPSSPVSMGEDLMNATIAIMKTSISNPQKLMKEPMSFMTDMTNIMMGKGVSGDKKDNRFKDETWELNPVYKQIMQTYLALSERTESYIADLGLDEKNTDRAQFISGNLLSTMAPTNALWGNPEALKKAYETGGVSLLKGGQNYIDDLLNNSGMPSMVDKKAFTVGENLASTAGKVVYRTNMLELIQYAPTTKQVHSIPMLMVPPQINKFYVYDIAPGRSFIEYIVSQGFQVYVVSWKNPGPDNRDWSFKDYVKALEDATEVVSEIAGSEKINITGACSGGITAASLLGYLAAKEIDRVNSFSLLVSVLDSGAVDDTSLGLFIHREILEMAKMNSSNAGVLKGEELAKIFAWLRPNDLIWPYWVNNYLLGEEPPEFDLLFWNSDTTNLPAALHEDFLTMLKENPLVSADAFRIDGHPIDLKKATCDAYVVAGTTDHITPWEACYRTVNLLGGDTKFILSSSGHVQAIINPTTNKKAKFFTCDEDCQTSEEFMQKAELNQGSWWADWSQWLAERSGKKKAAPKDCGNAEFTPLNDAPGLYACE